MINKYRKKPVIIEAVIWTGNNIDEIKELAKNAVEHIIFVNNNLYIETLVHYVGNFCFGADLR